ncbi:MAG: HEPN domain-containing protein [Candidatus Edwardsbacteria bacterium]
MRKNKEEAERWFKQASYDFESAKRNFEQKIYSYTCFMCEQAAQKVLKAYLILKGERYIWEHSIQKLVERCSKYDEVFRNLRESGAILDKYYLTSRYPDAIAPPAIPYESYTKKEAKEAIDLVEEILNLVRNKIEGVRQKWS